MAKREDKTKGLFMCGKMDGLLEQYLSRAKELRKVSRQRLRLENG